MSYYKRRYVGLFQNIILNKLILILADGTFKNISWKNWIDFWLWHAPARGTDGLVLCMEWRRNARSIGFPSPPCIQRWNHELRNPDGRHFEFLPIQRSTEIRWLPSDGVGIVPILILLFVEGLKGNEWEKGTIE